MAEPVITIPPFLQQSGATARDFQYCSVCGTNMPAGHGHYQDNVGKPGAGGNGGAGISKSLPVQVDGRWQVPKT